MRARRLWWFALVVVPFAVRAQPAERFSLRGKLVDGITGQPMAGVPVTIQKNWNDVGYPVASGADGSFAFENLEADSYSLMATVSGERIRYHATPDGAAETISLGPAHERQNLVFALMRHSTVTGIVRDEFGDPMPGVGLTNFHRVWRDGQIVFDEALDYQADDRGRYKIDDLRPGEYYLCATFRNSANTLLGIAPQPGIADFQARGNLRFRTRTCYPAEPPSFFRIEWAQHLTVDFTIHSAPATPVRGRVTNSGGPDTNVELIREDTNEYTAGLQIKRADGEFDFDFVEPGRYSIAARSYTVNGRAAAKQPVVVGRAGASGIELTLKPTGKIEVSIAGERGAAKIPDSVQIGLRSVVAGAHPTVYASQPYLSGPLQMDSIPPGTYWLIIRTFGLFCAESAKLDGIEVLKGTVSIASGITAHLEVTLSTQCASIEGHVISRNKPAAFARYAVLISGSAKTPGDVYLGEAGEDGEFSVGGLLPGRYLLWAWILHDPAYIGPPSLAEVENLASVVVAAKGQKGSAGVLRVLQEAVAK